MKNRPEYKTGISMKMLFVTTFILLVAGSCHKINNTDTHLRDAIPEKSFVSILTDIYMADGLLALPKIRNSFSNRDSIANYIDIIENHGYSYEDMNSTMEYYFVKKPKKLISLYDQIIVGLSEMETRYENVPADTVTDNRGMWNGKPSYDYPSFTGYDNPEFSITIYPHRTFTFEFTVTLYPDDQSYNPCFTAWYCPLDSTTSGKQNYLPVIKYIKDGRPHTYSIMYLIPFQKPVVLKGSLLDYENNPGREELHASISGISFVFSTAVE
jgi:hypothetical protein